MIDIGFSISEYAWNRMNKLNIDLFDVFSIVLNYPTQRICILKRVHFTNGYSTVITDTNHRYIIDVINNKSR